jgi:hypothetical protein
MQHPAGEDAGREMPMRKVAFAGFIATAIEFYDLYIYGTAAALVLGGRSSRISTRPPEP